MACAERITGLFGKALEGKIVHVVGRSKRQAYNLLGACEALLAPPPRPKSAPELNLERDIAVRPGRRARRGEKQGKRH